MNRPLVLLIVDDNEADRFLCTRLLVPAEGEQFSFLEATTLAEARSVLAGPGPVDCILLDARLTDGDGVELLEELAGRPEAPPVIVMTGVEEERAAERARTLGAHGYLGKDDLATRLPDAVRSAVRAPAAGRRPS